MENDQTTENQQIDTPQSPTQPELTINDLQNIRALIETSVKRGAFVAQELSAVGAIYDRLNTFLNAVATAPKTENQ